MVHLRLGLAHNGGIVSSSHLRLPMHISCRKQFRGFVRCRVSDDTGEDKANAASSDQDTSKLVTEPRSLPNPLDAVDVVRWGGTLPSRRVLQSVGLASIIALGGNFGGITSFLLSLDGGSLAAKVKADIVVPVNGYKRCVDNGRGFEFRFPAPWLADQSLVRRAAERIERENSLDPPALQKKRRQSAAEPVAAYGPPGSTGEENVSVVVAPIAPGFQLESLGSPTEAGQKLLDAVIAPQGSGKVATLLDASERFDEKSQKYYTLEYTVKTDKWFRHNVSVYTVSRSNELLSLNAQCPESVWSKEVNKLKATADSFTLIYNV